MGLEKKDMLQRLLAIDEEVSLTYGDNAEFTCYIVGGGALVLLGYLLRSTHDIDALQVVPSGIIDILNKYDMNNNVRVFESNFADGYEKRAIRILPETKVVNFYVLSLEDLVVSKLCSMGSQGREKDIHDINEEVIVDNIDWNKLDDIVRTVRKQLFTPTAMNILDENYKYYQRKYRK